MEGEAVVVEVVRRRWRNPRHLFSVESGVRVFAPPLLHFRCWLFCSPPPDENAANRVPMKRERRPKSAP